MRMIVGTARRKSLARVKAGPVPKDSGLESPKANKAREAYGPHSTIEGAATVSDAWRIASIMPP
jgi:hypothetical protein